jgi:hypothetical protein
VKPGVLLHMRELLEPPWAVGALVRLLPRVDADVLNKLEWQTGTEATFCNVNLTGYILMLFLKNL